MMISAVGRNMSVPFKPTGRDEKGRLSKEMLTRTSDYDSVGEKTYRRIRTDIIFGKLAPGEKLKLDRLREHYGASVSTLRELLNRLSSEGLVVAEGQRGFE